MHLKQLSLPSIGGHSASASRSILKGLLLSYIFIGNTRMLYSNLTNFAPSKSPSEYQQSLSAANHRAV